MTDKETIQFANENIIPNMAKLEWEASKQMDALYGLISKKLDCEDEYEEMMENEVLAQAPVVIKANMYVRHNIDEAWHAYYRGHSLKNEWTIVYLRKDKAIAIYDELSDNHNKIRAVVVYDDNYLKIKIGKGYEELHDAIDESISDLKDRNRAIRRLYDALFIGEDN